MTIVSIADIHFNAVKSEKLYSELSDIFLSYIKKHDIDMIVFLGDFFHNVISMNSITARLIMLFMNNLIQICKDKNIIVRFIKGTSSHDNNQLENFKVFGDLINLKIINTVSEETISGFRILYVPEEYMKDPEDYYKDYFSEEYSIVFGHGTFAEVSYVAKKQEAISRAPIFDSDTFCNISRGPVLFGHIHTKCSIKNKINYVGSFSRWVYGEEESKGFLVTILTEDDYYNEFIENTMADKYDTITVESEESEEIIRLASNRIRNYLRIIVIDNKKNEYNIKFLQSYYRNKPEYKLQIVTKEEIIEKDQQEKKINELMKKYDFIFDPRISHLEKISKFIETRDSVIIPMENIKKIIGK